MQQLQNYPHCKIFLQCWAKDNSNDGSRLPISVPPTLIFEHGVPKAVLLPDDELSDFVTTVQGGGTSSFEAEFEAAQNRYLEDREYLKDSGGGPGDVPVPHIVTARRSPKDISQPMLLAAMSNPVMAPNAGDPEAVVAYFVGMSEGGNGGGDARVDVRYMNREQVKRFFSKRELPDREGIQLDMGADAHAAALAKQSAIMADCRVRERIAEVMDAAEAQKRAHEHRYDHLFAGTTTESSSVDEEAGGDNDGGHHGEHGDEGDARARSQRRRRNAQQQIIDEQDELYEQDEGADRARRQAQLILEQQQLLQRKPSSLSGNDAGGGSSSAASQQQQQNQQQRHRNSSKSSGLSPPPTPTAQQLKLGGSASGTSSAQQQQQRQQQQQQRKSSPDRAAASDSRMQLTGFLQRFEYTPSHHSEIVTLRWTRSYCDFERVRNSVLLEDRSRRAAERAATVDAPPTLVRRYSVTDRLKALMRLQADMLADRFNAALHQQGRSFVLTQATFLFRLSFHGHVYFLWCSKMQLDRHLHAGPSNDWQTLQHQSQQDHAGDDSSAPQQQQQQQMNSYLGFEPQVRYHAFGRKFLDVGQSMLDREHMLRTRFGLARELADLDEPLRPEVSDGSDEDDDGSPSRRGQQQQQQRRRQASLMRGGGGGSASPFSAMTGAGGDESVRAGTGLMPLYSEHRIAVTQAQRHLNRALPVSTALLTNINRRDSTSDGQRTQEILDASRSLRANRDTMLEILRKADFSLHGRLERPKIKHAAKMGRQSAQSQQRSSLHDRRGRSASPEQRGQHGGGGATSSAFIKTDSSASTVQAKMVRLLGRKGRQAALMMPDLIAQLDRERAAGGAAQLAAEAEAQRRRDQEEKRRLLELEFEMMTEEQQHQQNATRRRNPQHRFVSERDHVEEDEGDAGETDAFGDRGGYDANAHRGHKSPSKRDASSASAANTSTTSRHKMVLMRSVVGSWKSWVSVFFARMAKHFAANPRVAVVAPPADDRSTITVSTIPGENTLAGSGSDRAATPLAASVPVELLELHFRQFAAAGGGNNANNTLARNNSGGASSVSSGTGGAARSASPSPFGSFAQPRGAMQSTAQMSVAYWTERFESAGASVCTSDEAREVDRVAGCRGIDDSALHHCRVIPESDIFCVIVPSAEVSDRICKMIQRACVLSG